MAVEGYSNADWRASGMTPEGSYSPTQLFTAEDEIKTNAGKYKAGQIIAVLTILTVDANDLLVPWDPANADAAIAARRPVGVAAADMNTGNTGGGYNADTYGPYYESACFNPDLLVWPAALNTYEKRKQGLARAGAPFRVKRLL